MGPRAPRNEFIPTQRSLLHRLKDWDDQESWKTCQIMRSLFGLLKEAVAGTIVNGYRSNRVLPRSSMDTFAFGRWFLPARSLAGSLSWFSTNGAKSP